MAVILTTPSGAKGAQDRLSWVVGAMTTLEWDHVHMVFSIFLYSAWEYAWLEIPRQNYTKKTNHTPDMLEW